MGDFETEVKNLNNTSDYTAQFDPQDINSNKVMGVLAYLGILVLIPLLAAKDSPFARFHTNQGIIVLILGIAVGIVNAIVGLIPVVGTIIQWILIICIWIFVILGIVNVVNGKAKDLPLFGKIRILK